MSIILDSLIASTPSITTTFFDEVFDYDEFGGKTRKVTRSMLVQQHDRATLLSYKPKPRNLTPKTHQSDVFKLAQWLWKSFPKELKEKLRRILKDSNRDGIPDAFG